MVRAVAGLLIAAASVAWEQASPRAVGTLAIQTTPAEATVIVDGEVRGTTPIVLPNLAVGPHRVVIRRAGFLENSADVEVVAGRTITLDRALTPEARTEAGRASPPAQNAPAPPQRSSPPPESAPRTRNAGGGGGGSGAAKWIVIAGGAAAAAAVGASKAAKNAPPHAGTIQVTPQGQGLASATQFTFSLVGSSDPEGNPLTFAWDFGDGSSRAAAQGQTSVSKVYSNAGTFSVRVTVDDGRGGTVSASTSVIVKTLTGTWIQDFAQNGSATLSLTQTGGTFVGTYVAFSRFSNGSTATYSGSIANASLQTTSPQVRFTYVIYAPPVVVPCSLTTTLAGDPSADVNTLNVSATFIVAPSVCTQLPGVFSYSIRRQ